MAISPQEQADLDANKAKVEKIKLNTFDLMQTYLGMNEEELRHSGQKSKEGALLSSMTRAVKDCQAVWKAHVRKYPD